jgi:hypothetical protein
MLRCTALQGTAAERLLLASASRPISVFEVEEALAALDPAAYQTYLVRGCLWHE